MITNASITYFHKNKEVWEKYTFKDVWKFGGKGSNINKGYENANDVDVRIPMKYVDNAEIFTIGDIVVVGLVEDIEKQSDLRGKEFYNVTSININNFGRNPHVHLGGK